MLNQIRYFQAVVECNSFTKAAEKCHISQSAISQQIQSLENELGVTLIQREKRKLKITRPGEYFYRKTKELLDEYEQIIQETKKLADKNQDQIRIGMLKGFYSIPVYQAIQDFSQENPDILISIQEGNHEDLYEGVRSNQLDFLISDQRRAFSQIYHNHFLIEASVELEIKKDHPLYAQSRIEMKDLKEYPLILITSGNQKSTEEAYLRDVMGFEGEIRSAESIEQARAMLLGSNAVLYPELRNDVPPVGISRRSLYRGREPLTRKYHAFWKKSNSGFYEEDLAQRLDRAFNHL